jgi:uncharacterized protein (DUF1330 family)
MKTNYKIAAAVIGSFVLGVGAASVLHAQGTAPYYGVAEISVKDENGYKTEFLPKAQELIKAGGGKLIAGGFNKTKVQTGEPPANRYVIYTYPSEAAWEKIWNDGLKDLQEKVGSKYAAFRIFGVEAVEQK